MADEAGGTAVVIDSGGPAGAAARGDRAPRASTPTLLLLTHHHDDHVAENHVYKERYGVEILAHPLEAERLLDVDRTIEPGEVLEAGGLRIEPLHTPGHTDGMLSFVVNGDDVFTGDTLFKGSVGGVRAPGLDQLRGPQALDHGRADEAPAGDHRASRATPTRRRSATSGSRTPSSASGAGSTRSRTSAARSESDEATLVLWAPDYDGGHKAWVRWADGRDDIVPGSGHALDAGGGAPAAVTSRRRATGPGRCAS